MRTRNRFLMALGLALLLMGGLFLGTSSLSATCTDSTEGMACQGWTFFWGGTCSECDADCRSLGGKNCHSHGCDPNVGGVWCYCDDF